MKREEIIKIFEENHIAKGNATINATKLAEIFTKHEADLLKEFVEWLKDQNASYDEKLGLNMVCMDTLQLDDMLKYFIKEQKNETDNHN